MRFKKLLKTVFMGIIILYGNPLYTMGKVEQTIFVNPEDAKTAGILSVLNNYFIISATSNDSEPEGINSKYTCNPKKEYNFSSLVHGLYDLGYTVAYLERLYVEDKLKELRSELAIIRQKLNKASCIEVANHSDSEKPSEKNKNNNFQYFKYFGSALTGAGIMGLGIYCYWVLKKMAFSN